MKEKMRRMEIEAEKLRKQDFVGEVNVKELQETLMRAEAGNADLRTRLARTESELR